jgi:RND family efflux transporter MFP subunit
VLTAQTAVSTAQNELATASTALDTLLAQRAAGSGSGSSTPTTAPSTGTRSGGTTGGAPTGSSGSTKSTAPSAADLVKYQAAVDAAASQVAVAQQAIDQATISTPIAGTVVAVNLKAGDAVTADSSTANIVVKGEGGYEVSTTVSVTTIPEIKVGQPATVIPDGSTKALVGTVSSISVAPSTSSTTTSYTVVVGLTSDDADLLNGATGSVTIVTGHAASALAVPTSAVTTTGAKHTVKVLNGSKATVTTVKVGVVGDTWTEIKSGVNAGQTVVLANINQSLPGSATTATTSAANTIVSRIQGLARTGGGFGGGAGGFTPPNR